MTGSPSGFALTILDRSHMTHLRRCRVATDIPYRGSPFASAAWMTGSKSFVYVLRSVRDRSRNYTGLTSDILSIHVLVEGLALQRILTPELFPDEVFFAAFEALAHNRGEPNLNATPVAEDPSAEKGPASD